MKIRIKSSAAAVIVIILVIFSLPQDFTAAYYQTCNYYKDEDGQCWKHITMYTMDDSGCFSISSSDLGDQFGGAWCNFCGEGLVECGYCKPPEESVGGCNETDLYFECSDVYQNVAAFSNQFSDMSQWWYFISIGSDGDEYKCMSLYKSKHGEAVHYRTSEYHSIDPVGRSDCLSNKAFDTFNNTICGQEPNAFNTGIYTTYNNPNSTYECMDSDGDGLDDVTSVDCITTASPRPASDLGNPDNNNNKGNPCGSPVWEVNMVNMNLFITDIPLWYNPPIGPPVRIQLSYNSQSNVTQKEPFGDKWMFNYGSYIEIEIDGNVIVFMPDGRRDVFIPDGLGRYTKPFGVFNTLTKVAQNHYELELLDGTVYVYNVSSITNPSHIFLGEIRDAYSQQLNFVYNSNDQLAVITDALGEVTTLIYNTDGMIERISDPFGRYTTFEYVNRKLKRVVDTGGYWTKFSYDTDVFITSIENEKGTWGFYIEPADGMNNNSNFYPAPGEIMGENYRITITDPLGIKEEYYYFGKYSWYVNPRDYVPYVDSNDNNYRNARKTYHYLDRENPKGKIKKILYPEGGYEEFTYDLLTGKPVKITDYHNHSKQYTYNNNGFVTSFRDAKGKTTTINYYLNDIDVQKIEDSLGTITYTYNNAHDVTSITDRLNNITTLTYNSYGQITLITEAPAASIQRTTELVYNTETHNLTEMKRNGNTIASYTYDNIGRIKTYTDSKDLTLTYNYNNLNQITRITYPDTKFESFNYSTCCPRLIDSITDRAGFTTNYTYNELKRLIRLQSPEGTINFEYDANGNLTKIIDVNKNITSFEYNLDNRLNKKIYPDGKFVIYTHDPAGLLSRIRNSRKIEKNYFYDANHNILTVEYSDNTPEVTFTYDDYNRVITRIDGIGLYQYGYDANNRLTSINGPWENDTITFQYNELGQLENLIPQGGQAISYTFDIIGRMTGIQSGVNTYTYEYTGVSPLINSLTRPNGSFTEFFYNDPLKRLTEIANKDSTQEIINKHAFTYNNLDFIETETVTNKGPITSFREGETTYNYNNLNQLLNSTNPDRVYIYDNDGNMTWGYTPDGYVMKMTYDAENRLKSAEYTDEENVIHRTEFFYSGDNLLGEIKKYGNETIVSNTRFVRNGFSVLQERDADNNIIKEYIWGHDMGGVGGLLNLKHGGLDYSYLYDGKGNVTALLNSNQQIVALYRYDAYGNIMTKTGTLEQPFMFSTKRYDEKIGLYYYGYRFYNPSIGRWITRDPLGELGGINLYGFVGNNPVNWIDPWGLQSADDFARAFTGLSYHDAIGDAWLRDVAQVHWINWKKRKKSMGAKKMTEFCERKADFYQEIANNLQGISPSDVGIIDLITMVVQFGAEIESRHWSAEAEKYWTRYTKYKNISSKKPQISFDPMFYLISKQ